MAQEDQNRGPLVLAIFGTGVGIATVLVLLRIWVRIRLLRKVGADDWFTGVSLVHLSTLGFWSVLLQSNKQLIPTQFSRY